MTRAPSRHAITLVASLVAGLILCGALFLFGHESDASYAVNDGIWFATNAENRPLEGVMGHHPLFHIFINETCNQARVLGIENPGHFAVRLISGMFAAFWILLLWWIGRSRWAWLLLALPMLATRGFQLEVGTGENVVPASVAACAALVFAFHNRSLLACGFVFVLALLLREDNVLLLPALLFALSANDRLEVSPGKLAAWTIGCGLLALGGYALIFFFCHGDGAFHLEEFRAWLLHLAEDGPWSNRKGSLSARLTEHGAALGIAAIGLQHPPSEAHGLWYVLAGLTWSAGLVLIALMHGTDRRIIGRLVALTLVVLARAPFFLYFEAHNWEWWILPMMALVTLLCDAMHQPVNRSVGRVAGAAMLALALAGLTSWYHQTETLQLRCETMREEADHAMELLAQREDQVHVMAHGQIAHTAFMLRGQECQTLHKIGVEGLDELHAVVAAREGRPALLLLDRFIRDGQPVTLRTHADPFNYDMNMDAAPERPQDIHRRRDGKITIIGFDFR